MGIQDVLVAFEYGGPLVLDIILLEAAVQPNYGARYRPIPGGVMMASPHAHATVGFAVQHSWWWWIRDYVISGHLGPGGARIATGTQIWQPTIASGNEAGTVERVARLNGFADAALVNFGHVTPCHSTYPPRRWVDGSS